MFSELMTRISRSRTFSIWRSGTNEKADKVAAEPTFDIFRRLRHGPELVETVHGQVEACDRMKQIAAQKPGVRYFVSKAKTQSVIAEIDATIPAKRKWRRVVAR